ncbi:MFS transporter [Rheinheimera sediminis]|uniref:MFS transporter n=1 Tax=Rheinheimera sp. YQF-1 TaxID=2499626 RepID=UPI0016458C8F|nr:MFS transporter [Rheinheimera sp. YQF-1]
MNSYIYSSDVAETANSWGSVFAMSVCAFALVASEFLPVSLLTPLAEDLGVTEGLAGQGIAISGFFAVLASLFISPLFGKLDRKTLLLGLTAVMGLSGAIVAFAPDYQMYMLGRALIGVVVGGFWSMSAATAIRLVPSHQVPRALAIVNGGNALATVVAAPLGAWLGATVGWRFAFFCLVPLALMALGWLWLSLPSMPATVQKNRPGQLFKVFALLKRPAVLSGFFASSLMFMGQFALFTYLRPFLETVTGVQGATISFYLLVAGATGFIGTVFISQLLHWRFYQTLIAIPLVMTLTALLLTLVGERSHAVLVLLGLWGLTATAAPVGWWAWIAQVFPDDAEAGGGLFVAMVQLSIALGSTVGGLLFDHSGYQSTFLFSAALLLISAGLTVITAPRADPMQQKVGSDD